MQLLGVSGKQTFVLGALWPMRILGCIISFSSRSNCLISCVFFFLGWLLDNIILLRAREPYMIVNGLGYFYNWSQIFITFCKRCMIVSFAILSILEKNFYTFEAIYCFFFFVGVKCWNLAINYEMSWWEIKVKGVKWQFQKINLQIFRKNTVCIFLNRHEKFNYVPITSIV